MAVLPEVPSGSFGDSRAVVRPAATCPSFPLMARRRWPLVGGKATKRRILVVGLLALSGCVSQPQYQTPKLIEDLIRKSSFPSGGEEPAREWDQTAFAQWWIQFGGRELDGLVSELIATSPDLEAARALVASARAVSRQALARRLPSVSSSGDRGTLELLDPEPGPDRSGTFETSSLTLSASWDLDVFGRLRASNRAEAQRFCSNGHGT